MLRTLFARIIDRFEKEWSYDASYMRHIVNADPIAFAKFSILPGLTNRRAAPGAALAAAGIVGTVAEDCGPCTQISVDIAARSGVPAETLRAILAGDEAAMGRDAALAWRFARASLARDMEVCDPLRDEIVARWGQRGLTAVAFALTTARMYPTLKYALGYGKACSRVRVGGEDVAPLPLAA